MVICVIVRSKELFYKLFLINTQERKAIQLCPFVNSGIMHNAFQPYLRSDKYGIDYTVPAIVKFDTMTALNKRLRQIGKPEVSW